MMYLVFLIFFVAHGVNELRVQKLMCHVFLHSHTNRTYFLYYNKLLIIYIHNNNNNIYIYI